MLWTLTTNLSGYFDARPLPSNYTASNLTVAVKTAVEVRQCCVCHQGRHARGLLGVPARFDVTAAVEPMCTSDA